MRLVTGVLALASVGFAQQQQQPTARDFLFSGFENTMSVNLKAMREREIWDELEVSALKLAFRQIEKEAGFELDAVDRFTLAVKVPKDSKDVVRDTLEVYVTEGNRPLSLPPRVSGRNWESREVAGKTVRYRERYESGRIFYVPHPHVQVEGSWTLLRPILEKDGHRGLPSPDVMSLLSGRDDRLAYAVGSMEHPSVRAQFGAMLGDPEWPTDDEPRFFGLQVLVRGDRDDPHLVVEAALRHARVGDGLAISKQGAEQLLAKLVDDQRLMSLRKVLKAAQFEVDGTDLVLRLDLGRVRNAVGQLAALLLPLMTPQEDKPAGQPAGKVR
ncbi:MAG: hypothetical protein KAI24_06190 [Planctomycetes bacterium]|nr:hypothetical protein [Planctomycetota bacterium]